MRYRKILHIDLDAFFCSVEELIDPSLHGTVFATGGSADRRGVVTSCSYAARKLGIHSAMPMKSALQKVPGLKVVQGHYGKYQHYSRQVMAILEDTTPLVKQISIDEAFIDVTDMSQPGCFIAQSLQKRIRQEAGLPCSIGIASNMLVAKIATNIAKSSYRGDHSPQAILEVPGGTEAGFLHDLPINELWGIGKKSATAFSLMGIKTIGDLAAQSDEFLEQQVGRFAHTLKLRALGMDERPVGLEEDVKSVSNEITFDQDVGDEADIIRTLRYLSEKVAFRLRKQALCGKTIRLKIRWPDFETHTRQFSLSQPTNHDTVILKTSVSLLHEIWKQGKKVRLLGVAVAGLTHEMQQLSFLDEDYQKEGQLLQAMDDLKARFGNEVIKRGWEYHSRAQRD